jgi:hypothetical protein
LDLATASERIVVADRSKANEVAGSPARAGEPGTAIARDPIAALVSERNNSLGNGASPFGGAAAAATGTERTPTAVAVSKAANLRRVRDSSTDASCGVAGPPRAKTGDPYLPNDEPSA